MSAVPALATEPCPNEAIREQQGVTYLPDCRAFEQVTPAHKGAFDVVFEGATADGSQVSFDAAGGLLGTAESERTHVFSAARGSSGWSSLALTPFDQPSSPEQFSFIPGSEDTSRVTFITSAALVPQDTNTSPDLYQAADGHVTLLSHDASGQAIGVSLANEGSYIATRDGRQVFFESSVALTAGATDEQANVYEADSTGTVSLVSQTTAGGDPANPNFDSFGAVLGTGGTPPESSPNHNFANAVSSDGSTVFFTSNLQYDPSVPDDGVRKLFMRRDGITKVVSASKTSTPAESPVIYEGAAADGSQVFFSTTDQLTADDHNTVRDIYRYTTATGALTRITGGNPGFNDNVFGVDFETGGGVVAISADGSHVYFVTHDQLTAQAPAGHASPLLYEWTPAGTTYIAALSPDDVSGYESTTGNGFFFAPLTSPEQADRPARTTPDGTHLVFESHADLTPDDTNNTEDVYEWSDTGGLVRVSRGSINSAGPAAYDATIGSPVATTEEAPRDYATGASIFGRVIADDGSRVFFSTRNALTPYAAEGVRSIYEYGAGHTTLVSPGRPAATDAFYEDSSQDGRDVFFTTRQSLSPGDDDGGASDVYDARVAGGFSQPPAATSGCTHENACPAAPLAGPGEPVSALFTLPGNATPSALPTAEDTPAKAVPLTRAQRLASALRVCARKPRRRRASCDRHARSRYARKSIARNTDRRGR